MATVSGVPVSNISKISSIDATTIVKISSIATANIPGWPGGSGPSCTTVSFGYADSRIEPPSRACSAPPQSYDFDATNNLLYTAGGCGSSFADRGFYSDGRNIYFWDGEASWTIVGACGR